MRLTLYRYSRGHGRINGFMVAVFVLIIMKIPYPSSLYFFLLQGKQEGFFYRYSGAQKEPQSPDCG